MGGVLELYRGLPAERGMAAVAVVEPFDVFEYGAGELEAGVPPLPVQQLGLHPCPERLGEGVVIRVTDAAQGRQESGLAGALGEDPGGELGSVVPVDDAAGRRAA